ncbi:response regulator transcription factor [Nitratifractor sp.]|uniref:response regulator transcription factor n=1 Tax=Nitratifractor sp. TaxID=2268144 RepID=UPI0025F01F02|nr:response regulator transcription factor [Nitratifractor sp.]
MPQTNIPKILLLEDDRLYSETLCDWLEEEGFEVEACHDPHTAFELCYARRFDLYLFDINLPFQNGLETFRQLRQSGDETPVIFLTSREDKASLLEGFEIGADDYLRKPVDLEELTARLAAALRRRHRGEGPKTLGVYTMDPRSRDLLLEGKPLRLGRKIYDLLELFLERSGETVSQEEIKARLWRYDEEASEGAIRVYITRLKKLFPQVIQNIRGVGYRFDLSKIDRVSE